MTTKRPSALCERDRVARRHRDCSGRRQAERAYVFGSMVFVESQQRGFRMTPAVMDALVESAGKKEFGANQRTSQKNNAEKDWARKRRAKHLLPISQSRFRLSLSDQYFVVSSWPKRDCAAALPKSEKVVLPG